MGLDCIPHTYPCKKEGTAVIREDKIDCDLTIAADGCPWKRDAPETGAVYGIMGTYCWYRGKVGEWLLDTLREAGIEPPHSLYGYEREGGMPHLTPDECQELHRFLVEHGEKYAIEAAKEAKDDPQELKGLLESYRYMTWWVDWAGQKADGVDAWY